MIDHAVFAELARTVIDANKYMVLATADATGRPWATPVYFTPEGYSIFYWVSSPEATHSRNIAERPAVSIVVFDSQVPIGGAEAVYLSGSAEQVPEGELGRCAEIFGTRNVGDRRFAVAELRAPEPLRLYRAIVTESYALIKGRYPDNPRGVDDRVTVVL